MEALKDLKVVMVGAGSAARGVMTMIKHAMVRHGLSDSEACANFWVVDQQGLSTNDREKLHSSLKQYARVPTSELPDGASIEATVRQVRPNTLIGLSGAGRLFTPSILHLMGQSSSRPIIFPMSNPTSQMECTAYDA